MPIHVRESPDGPAFAECVQEGYGAPPIPHQFQTSEHRKQARPLPFAQLRCARLQHAPCVASEALNRLTAIERQKLRRVLGSEADRDPA
jgi:hypothetical protein